MRRLIFEIALLAAFAAGVALLPSSDPNPLLVQADYQRCVTVHPAPLLIGPGVIRVGQHPNNRGVA